MNYHSLLDPFFSSGWISFGTLFGLLILGLIFRKPLFINRKRKGWLGLLYFSLFMLGFFSITLINPMNWGYGKPDGVKSVLQKNNLLFVMDYQMAGGSEGTDPEPYHRVHVIDKSKGEKQFRFVTGHAAELILISDDAIICRNPGKLNFYSITNGDLLASWDKETLPGLFPELASGIDQFDPFVRTETDPVVNVTALDGRHWQLDLKTRKIRSEKTDAPLPDKKGWNVSDDHLDKDGHYTFMLHGKSWEDKRKQICLTNDTVLNPALYFIEGEFIALHEPDSCFVILHYESTTKLRWILSGISLDGKRKLWDIRQTGIGKGESGIPLENCWTSDRENGILFFVSQDEIFGIQMKTGTVLWRTKL